MSDLVHTIYDFLCTPVRAAPWTDGRGFWLAELFDDRFQIVYVLLAVPILLAAPRRWLRPAFIGTGLAFLAYLLGLAYPLFWLALCCGLYRLSESFYRESQRTDVWRGGPILAAILVLGGGYFASFFLSRIELPAAVNEWLWRHAPVLYPLGLRGWSWEPDWLGLLPARLREPAPQLFATLFWNPHNIGTAYLAVRMLHYFSDLRGGAIPPPRRSLPLFLSYVCYAPTLMQGPIERYGTFHDEVDTCFERRGWHALAPAAWRIGLGLSKGLIATLYFMPTIRSEFLSGHYYARPHEIQSTAFLYFAPYFHIFWLYLEFSGYCDISAGVARLLGLRQVENFAWPWRSTSLREFWRRWHISLSSLLRDYVYIPLGGNRRRTTLNLCLTFALIGIWHVPHVQLLLWGVLMGLMLAVNQHWVQWMKSLDEPAPEGESPNGFTAQARRVRTLVRRAGLLGSVVAWALTMHCFAHSLLLFFGGSAIAEVTIELGRRLIGSVARFLS